ncbi:MAG: sn-glycerol-3-phosphate ABC transporter ATP-binding protein UgpC [Phycisphaerales bacterium]|nr:MAG: sn-glycerol-3-phosphate ABC transporter ATP-binding protein UgpC [Phycisphaerales bacterium]
MKEIRHRRPMASVTFQRVCKVFSDGTTAVSELDLHVEDGRFVVLLGPSGCGKTTTLRLLAGLEDLTSGNILLDGSVVNDLEPKDRDLAMVFQNYALYPHMTVEKNLGFSLKLRGVKRAEIRRAVSDVAALLGLDDLLRRRPRALSGGQCQRVALGRAIIRKPCAFLFDEPLSNLDAKLRMDMRAELRALHKRLRTTSIYVTHDQAEAMTLGEQVAVMCDGHLQQYAEPLEVYDRPANRFVAGFVGTPTMNFVDGDLTGRGLSLTFECPLGRLPLPAGHAARLATHPERRVTLGIRPESLVLCPPAAGSHDTAAFPATVRMIEPLGDRCYMHLDAEQDVSLVAAADPHQQFVVGDVVPLGFDIRAAHFFETGPVGRNLSPAHANPLINYLPPRPIP